MQPTAQSPETSARKEPGVLCHEREDFVTEVPRKSLPVLNIPQDWLTYYNINDY